MKKFLRVIAVVTLAAVMFLSFSGCGKEEEAQEALDAMFAQFQEGDYNSGIEYISEMKSSKDFLNCANKFNEEDFPTYEMHKAFFESIEYKVLSAEKESPVEVKFEVEIEALDLNPVAEELFKVSEQYNYMAENNEAEITEEELSEILSQQMIDISKDYLESPDKKNQKSTVTVVVCYEKDKVWRVYPDAALVNALTGGVYEKYNEIVNEYIEKNK